MGVKNKQADVVDIMVRTRHARGSSWSSLLGFGSHKDKWKHHKGPNPLTMMGLDRS